MVIIVAGLPGSGKSFFSRKLSRLICAEYLSSDIIRKELFSLPTYSEGEKQLVYSEMRYRMLGFLSLKKDVVLDATFIKHHLRSWFISSAKAMNTKVHLIVITADEDTTRKRTSRKRNYSDADYDIYLKMKDQFEWPTGSFITLDSSEMNIRQMFSLTLEYIRSDKKIKI